MSIVGGERGKFTDEEGFSFQEENAISFSYTYIKIVFLTSPIFATAFRKQFISPIYIFVEVYQMKY